MLHQMRDSTDQYWREQYSEQLPMSDGQWPHTQQPQLSGFQPLSTNCFEEDEHTFGQFLARPSVMSSNMVYPPITWASEIEIATHCPTAFPSALGDALDDFHQDAQAQTYESLHPPVSTHGSPGSAYSPHSYHSGFSRRERPSQTTSPAYSDKRPALAKVGRPATDPGPHDYGPSGCPHNDTKHEDSSEADDEEYVPQVEPKARGKKRQRIPHTAVERRYRENLNSNLDKLRQTVPALAARRGQGASKGAEGGEGVKPSKCEILNGAIEHIGSLSKQNDGLRHENRALRARMEDMQNWYRTNAR